MLLGIASLASLAWLALGAWPPPAWRTLARFGAGLSLGALIAGLQFVLIAELVGQSARDTIAGEFEATASAATGTLEAAALARLTLFCFLPGLVAFAFGGWPRRAALALHGFCVAMLLGLWVLVCELPGLSGIRHAWMGVLTSPFSLAYLVAIGADGLVEPPLRGPRDRAAAWLVAIVAVPSRVAASFTRNGAWKDTRSPGDGLQVVLRNQDRPGRAWVTYGANVNATPAATLARLVARDFDPRKEVILETAPARAYAALAAAPPSTLARVSVPSPTRLEVELELPRPGILVVSETWYPGWRAWVDGAPAEILRANYLMRGVELAAGAHHVRFEYQPVSLRIGAALSLTGVAAAAGLAWSDRRARAPASATART